MVVWEKLEEKKKVLKLPPQEIFVLFGIFFCLNPEATHCSGAGDGGDGGCGCDSGDCGGGFCDG